MHVQEYCFTAEEIQNLLELNNLKFCGFMADEITKATYLKHFQNDSNLLNLENWQKYEINYPDTFKSMYQFWAQKNDGNH